MKLTELGSFIREQRRSARLSLRKLSDLAGISNPYLSQIERGLRKPSAEILQAIAKALRISAETLYVRAGILEENRDTDLVAEILKDPTLSERQKQALIEIYRSFQRERAEQLEIPVEFWKQLQQGYAVEFAGRRISADEVLGPPRAGIKVSMVTDTRPINVPPMVAGASPAPSRHRVDLPDSFAPSTPTSSPGSRVRSISATAAVELPAYLYVTRSKARLTARTTGRRSPTGR
jgi:transcriptional regulator with XRE-family HTH domain